MPVDLKNVIQAAFDEASIGYDRPAMRFFDNSAKNLASQLSLKGNELLLDVCTGTGKIALELAKRAPKGHITAIDISPGMLRLAEAKAAQTERKNISFQIMDVDRSSFPAAGFDGLTCGFGAHFWPNMEKSLAHLVKAVKKEGFVAIASFAKGSFEPHAGFCLKRFAEFGVKLPDSYSLERLDNPEKNERLLKAVGLKDVHVKESQAGYFLTGSSDWWDLVVYTGYRAFLNQLTSEQAGRFKEVFLTDVEATKKDQGIYLDVKVITAIGRKQ